MVVVCWLGGTEHPAINAPISIRSTVFISTSFESRLYVVRKGGKRDTPGLVIATWISRFQSALVVPKLYSISLSERVGCALGSACGVIAGAAPDLAYS